MHLQISFDENDMRLEVDFGEIQEVSIDGGNFPRYSGPYEIEPAGEEQILQTKDKITTQDIIIKPVPKEYGLVTYNQDKTLRIT